MEMDSVEGDSHGDINDDESADHSFPPEAFDPCGVSGDPELGPRVGDDYQAEIPCLIAVSDYVRLLKNSIDAEIAGGSPHGLGMGLPIPVMWINEEFESNKYEHVKETLIVSESDNIKCKAEPMDVKFKNGITSGESEKLVLKQELMAQMHKKPGGVYCPVPGSAGDSWSGIEEASFLLGLYIFGKRLVLVKKFVGSKQMGDVLSFYHGKFYKSDRYKRWKECKKMRSRKCIFGQRIFMGPRQHELFSRLFSHVSEECQNSLLEVSKTFGEGKILLEEYVFILKARVGLNALVEAVGIGTGKKDLTGIATETLKSNHVAPVRPEIPTGKACSSLTPLEIVNFLTGGFRLSKARSSDLFWEAVWPRLLARGWHSEQPYPGFSTGSKNSLVFLIPGIKKFSKRKLVKGSHYFDSVSDVLNKVASDPELLELETGANNENGWTDETKLDEQDFPNQQRHCYLQPRTPNRSSGDVMKFTVVDTSLPNRKTSKRIHVSKSIHLGRSDDKYFEYDTSEWEHQASCQGLTTVTADLSKNENIGIGNDMRRGKAAKCQKIQKMVSEKENHVAPVLKRRRKLVACNHTDTIPSRNHFLQGPVLQQDACSSEDHPELSEKTPSQVDLSEEKLSSTSTLSREASPVNNGEGKRGDSLRVETFHENPQCRTFFDLNMPPSLDAETDEPFTMTERQDDQTKQEPDAASHSTMPSECGDISEQQPAMNSRRHSTRSRPLTTKVLESFAYGFFDTKQKRKSRDEFPRDDSILRPSRRARTKVGAPDSFDTSLPDFSMQETGSANPNNNADGYSELDMGS
ncbi:uncharacterized protein LOC103943640 isoform X3 [Pyrus x bretschneideri]|uniref:uncharacterized protein LOC103943640 isoform X3 n=1 Tax=Pyrus x bretschneideri TaxID=225117 RepID=UPI002030E57C|nr:uncharacterized protein LOC103943640 isoform X3 [Pyrus x bretschneideri]